MARNTPADGPLSEGTGGGGVIPFIFRVYDSIVSGLNGLGTGWIFVIMVMINTDVFSRYLFNRPITGVPLIITLSIIAIVFLQLPSALRGGRLTRSDVLIAKLLDRRPVLGHTLQGIYHAAGAVLMVVIFEYSLPFFLKAWTRNTYEGLEGDFTFPSWPVKVLILVGAAVCAVQFARELAKDIRVLKAAAAEAVPDRWGFVIGVVSALAVGVVFLILGSIGLSAVQIGLISVLFVLFLVYVGVHVGVALALLSFVCVWMIRDDPVIAGRLLALAAAESLQRYEFGVIPLFVLMGLLVSVSDIGRDTYDVANHLFRRVTAGLGMATVGANAVFAAVTGTSIASASVFTKVAVPEMLRLNYKPRFAVGVVAGSSVLGMLIPPSLLLILFGILSETSIGDLFIAGIVPGIVLSVAYCVLIWIMAKRFPDKVAAPEALETPVEPRRSAREMLIGAVPTVLLILTIAIAIGGAHRGVFSLAEACGGVGAAFGLIYAIFWRKSEYWPKALPILLLIVVVLGGIYGGVFTATEAGGVGALGALILTIVKRRLTWGRLWHALSETGNVTAAICFLLISAHLYSRMIAMTGIPNVMEAYINASGLGVTGLVVIYIILMIVLGTILDAGSIMLITVPLLVQPLQALGVDMVWFGIITIIGVEIGLLTPPLGLACFVIHNNLQDDRIKVEDIFWGAAPFALTMLIVLILVTVFPQIALVLVPS